MNSKKLTAGIAFAGILVSLFVAVKPLRVAAVQVLGIVTCASASPCTADNNTSTGAGLQGTSNLGKGVVGQTKSTSITFTNRQSGVAGEDLSTSGYINSGVLGTSPRGTGVLGNSNTGLGVDGESSYIGIFGKGSVGVQGNDNGSVNSDAVVAKGHGGRLIRANNRSGSDVFLLDNGGNATITGDVNVNSLFGGTASTSAGVSGVGKSIGTHGAVALNCVSPCAGIEGDENGTASSIAVRANGRGGFLFVGNNSLGRDIFTVDDGGNVHAHSFSSDLAAAGKSAATMEDFGEATLVAGQAYVRLKSGFAVAIAHRRPYLVFITPQGAVGGTLYVSQKTSSGFAVRESGAFRSSVPFDYRIVGPPEITAAPPSDVLPLNKSMPNIRRSVTIPRADQQPHVKSIH